MHSCLQVCLYANQDTRYYSWHTPDAACSNVTSKLHGISTKFVRDQIKLRKKNKSNLRANVTGVFVGRNSWGAVSGSFLWNRTRQVIQTFTKLLSHDPEGIRFRIRFITWLLELFRTWLLYRYDSHFNKWSEMFSGTLVYRIFLFKDVSDTR